MSFSVGTAPIRRVAMLTNPAAGKGAATRIADRARGHLNQLGVDVVAIQGSSAAASRELAATMVADDRIDALVVCGGDGLISLALQEQAQSDKPLGIIPAGTGNDHAREYNIPTDPLKAAEVVAAGFWTTTDLGRMTQCKAGAFGSRGDMASLDVSGIDAVSNSWFGTIACAGFDSLVSDRTNKITWPKGRNRYNLAIVMEFLNFHSIPTRLVLDPGMDTQRVLDGRITLCAMGNTRSYGGGMKICPDADHHDGLLDVTILGQMSKPKVATKFGKIFSGAIRGEEGIDLHRAHSVAIDMPGINGYADGDLFAPLPMLVEIVPGAGRYIVPRP
ncbi:diacylglycerol kinase [Corynebacterium heidelbergense]|uniref:Diacylglycerol kinase n=1 Tax=Corynebacterium heidelbergense TaxID=2055947 RepID=A0A364VBW5_9CORY|nr:diacylglycerol kinase [Corynebacterium heidelbergense]RAV34056.1 diacylglycerol kinase [Corynebacterium heidelbergense]WCZ35645.1 Diacylglycerol kinase [Corynebacterium heidelbergense]